MSGRDPVIVVVVAAFFAGWVIRATVGVPDRVVRAADLWVLKIALPALVVAKMGTVDLGASVVVPVAAAWTAMATCAMAVTVVARAAHWDRSTTGALLMVAVLGNTSFLGLGVVEGVLGADHLSSAVAYDQPGTFLALATWGSWVASRWGSGESGVRPVVNRLVRFPPFLALVVAVTVRPVGLPDVVADVFAAVGTTVAPVAMATVGARFTLAAVRRTGPVAAGLGVKMVAAPVVVALVAASVGDLGDVAWRTSIVQASAPPMVTAGLVAVAAGLDEDVATSMVGWGTLLGLVTMPLVSLFV